MQGHLSGGRRASLACAGLVVAVGVCGAARADVVTEWTQAAADAIRASAQPPDTQRTLAIVNAAIFDAVDGIDRRYVPYHVTPAAAAGASRRAAAAEAAYEALTALIPDQQALLQTRLSAAMAAIRAQPDGGAMESDAAISSGTAWGKTVADAILAWRAQDGYSVKLPAFTGGTAPGEWRPTPPKFPSGAGRQLVSAVPWGIRSTSQFRPGPPPALASDVYAGDLNEIKAIGRRDSTTRTADQTDAARFWLAPPVNTTLLWTAVALQMAAAHPMALPESARAFALMSLAQADAILAGTEAKYFYTRWRPITAIQEAASDGNPATDPDPAWIPFLDTPADPDYPSNAGIIDGANATTLTAFFGPNQSFTLESSGLPGKPRTFASFWAASTEGSDARIYQGVHTRSAVRAGEATAMAVAGYDLANLMRPIAGGGDVNQDGRVDLSDAVLALESAVGIVTLTADQKASADVNGDGAVDLKDVTALLRQVVGL